VFYVSKLLKKGRSKTTTPRMGKPSAAKSRAVPAGPPRLYEETVRGSSFVVDVGSPIVWANTTAVAGTTASVEGVGKHSSEEGIAVTARWGHSMELSPNEGVLCIIGGRPCSRAVASAGGSGVPVLKAGSAVSADGAPQLLAWTSAHHVRSSKAPHVWQCAPCEPAHAEATPSATPATSADEEGSRKLIRWPHYAPWWVTWEANTHEGERPTHAWVDGGWGNGHRLAYRQAFVLVGDSYVEPSRADRAAIAATRSHHTVTAVQGVRYRFGGEMQDGTVAALERVEADAPTVPLTPLPEGESDGISRTAAAVAPHNSTATSDSPPPARPESSASAYDGTPMPASPSPQPQQQQQQAPPPRAAHGACCLCQRYLIVFGGRRVDLQDDGVDAARAPSSSGKAGGGSGGRVTGSAGKASAASKAATSASKRGAPAGKGGDGSGSGTDATSTTATTAVLTALKDVAVYDTRLAVWLPVVITGGPGPRPRYAAAVAAVPSSTSPIVAGSAVQHREVLVVGGLDGSGQVCDDAWLLQILSGADSELADAPDNNTAAAGGGAASKEGGSAATATSAGSLPVVTARWVRLNLPSNFASIAASSVNSSLLASPAAAAAGASPAVALSVLARHHAAAVVSHQRIAYVVGGCGMAGASTVAAQPTAYTLALPPLTSTSVRVDDADGVTTPTAAAGAGAADGAGAATPPSHAAKK
jgi:hypothetical protein